MVRWSRRVVPPITSLIRKQSGRHLRRQWRNVTFARNFAERSKSASCFTLWWFLWCNRAFCQRSNRVAQASQFVNVLLATSKLSSPLAVSHQWPVLVKSLATTGRSISSLHCHHGITASWHCHLFISRHHGIMAFMASCLCSSTCCNKRKPNGTSALFFMAAPRV